MPRADDRVPSRLPIAHAVMYHLPCGTPSNRGCRIEPTLRGVAMVARGFTLALLGMALAVASAGTAGEKDKEVKKDAVKDKDKAEPAKDQGKDKKDKKEKKEPPKVE